MKKNYFSVLVLVAILFANSMNAATIYVSPTGLAGNGGTNWSSDAKDLVGGIAAATSTDEIWVMAGTYNASATLLSLVSKKIYGGFNGTELAISDRKKSDMDANGVVEPWEFTTESKIDGGGLYPVFSVSGNGSVVDGMVFQNGFYNATASNTGTGLNVSGGAATNIISIVNCTVRGNKTTTVGQTGAAGSTYTDGAPGVYAIGVGVTLDKCLIEKNTLDLTTNTTYTATISTNGIGIMLANGCQKNSIVRNNLALSKVFFLAAAPTTPVNNFIRGGGVFVKYSTNNQSTPNVTLPSVINCVVANNEIRSYGQTSGLSGAGLYIYDAGYVQNCTVVKNKFTPYYNADGTGGERATGDGGGIYVRLASTASASSKNRYVHNTIAWGNYSPAAVSTGEYRSQIYVHTPIDYSTTEFKNVITT